jgi:hypothetical protein
LSAQKKNNYFFLRAGPPSVHAVGLGAVAAALLGGAALLPLDAPPLSLLFCPLRAATGIPCFSCGCTHAFHFAVRGQLLAAVDASPLGTVLALLCAAHLAWTLLRLAGLPWAPLIPPRTVRWAAAFAVAANWLFLVAR